MILITKIKNHLFGLEHEFDLDNPIINKSETRIMDAEDNTIRIIKNMYTGYRCKHCDKVLWLDKEDMGHLPYTMRIGCKRSN